MPPPDTLTDPNTAARLEAALALHRAGQLAEARDKYEQVLSADPTNNEALHGLALIAVDLGQPRRAVPLLLRCVALAPANALFRASLGLALLKSGQPEPAATQLLAAANAAPHLAEPRVHLAEALGALGRWGQAAAVLEQSVTAAPDNAALWAAKGQAERRLKRHAAAEQSFRRALTLAPDDSEVLNNLGVVVRAQGRLEEAAGFYREALARSPDNAVAHANLGNVLDDLNHPLAAENHLHRALVLNPDFIDGRYNLAAHLTRQERAREAIPHFRAVTQAAPQRWDAWTNLGVALLAVGDVAEAEVCYRRAIALKPGNAEAHYDLAWVLLLTGKWNEGWREYEWRWELPNFSSRKRTFDKPLWDGTPLPKGALLLHAEQGLGDAIQFVRYAALAKQRCQRVVIECPKPLVRIFEGLAGADEVVAAGTPLPPFDAHAPFMSLPRIFGTTPDTVPATAVLKAPSEIPRHLKLPRTGKPRVGLVWAGSPDNKIDRRRTCPARMLAPLVAAMNADFVSLQVGHRAEEVSDLPAGRVIFACEEQVKDFADTAAVVSQLDLVVGVDTAVMHLAATMGKPAWVLIPFMPDYRWLLGRDDTPWYPSMRLFRQEKAGDWQGVIERTVTALTNWQQSLE